MKTFVVAGNVLLLLFMGCGKNKSIPNDHGSVSALKNQTFFDSVGEVNAYNPNAQYKDEMKECIYAITIETSCTPAKLPLLGLSNNAVTVDAIMSRLMVSHPFLGDTFKQVLLKLNPEALKMFGSVNTIVISDKINPSFYYSYSGAIYLSGMFFWRNYDQWVILNKTTDSREENKRHFQFLTSVDYSKDGKSLNHREDDNTQSIDEITLRVSRLLYHELAHSNDFFPESIYKSADFDKESSYANTAYENYLDQKTASSKISELSSLLNKHIAQVLYMEEAVLPTDKFISGDDVVSEFRKDLATDFYSYSTPMEDHAMNIEEALMLYYNDRPRTLKFYKLPSAYFVPPEGYKYQLIWGEKSRVLNPSIRDRALKSVEISFGKQFALKVRNKLAPMSSQEIKPQ